MKKILITGSNGFIATEIIDRLSKYKPHWILYPTARDTLDVVDTKSVDKFFDANKIDVVIHCAISGGRRNQPDTPMMFYNNCLMFENLVKHRDKYDLMLTFGSGAEKDRTQDIMECDETEFGVQNKSIPKDYYGLSKYIIGKRIADINDNIINLRIFNVFGTFEAEDRMVKANIMHYFNNTPIEIHKNRYMDFTGANDLYALIDYCIEHGSSAIVGRTINVSYQKKVTLVDIANIINNLSTHKSDIIIKEEGLGPAYCGSGLRLKMLGLKLNGLKKSIRQVYTECQNI